MSDDFAPQAPAPTSAVIEPPTPSTPELGSQTPVSPKPETPKAEPKQGDKPDAKAEVSKNAGDAIKRASERLKAMEAEKAKTADAPKDKPEPKAPEKPAETQRARSQDGKFSTESPSGEKAAAQEPTQGVQPSEGRKPFHDAPARLSDNAKREWANAPDSVKEDVYRVIGENEKGIQKYKESAERYDLVREYDELARKNGRAGVHESLKQVVEIEKAFERNPIEGMKRITEHFGLDLNAVAAHVMGQNPNQQLADAHNENQRLRQQIQQMESAARMPDLVAEFAAKHDRFDELSEDIAFFLKGGIVQDLETAYEMAARFRPASNAGAPGQPLNPAQSAEAHNPAPAPAPPNPAGSKSVSGAPSGGVNPQARQPVPKSNREALQRAAARASR